MKVCYEIDEDGRFTLKGKVEVCENLNDVLSSEFLNVKKIDTISFEVPIKGYYKRRKRLRVLRKTLGVVGAYAYVLRNKDKF